MKIKIIGKVRSLLYFSFPIFRSFQHRRNPSTCHHPLLSYLTGKCTEIKKINIVCFFFGNVQIHFFSFLNRTEFCFLFSFLDINYVLINNVKIK